MTSLRVGLFLLVLLSVTAAALVSVVVRGAGGKSNPFADEVGAGELVHMPEAVEPLV